MVDPSLVGWSKLDSAAPPQKKKKISPSHLFCYRYSLVQQGFSTSYSTLQIRQYLILQAWCTLEVLCTYIWVVAINRHCNIGLIRSKAAPIKLIWKSWQLERCWSLQDTISIKIVPIKTGANLYLRITFKKGFVRWGAITGDRPLMYDNFYYFYYKYGGPPREICQASTCLLENAPGECLLEASLLGNAFLHLPLTTSRESYFEFFCLYMLIFTFLFYIELLTTWGASMSCEKSSLYPM